MAGFRALAALILSVLMVAGVAAAETPSALTDLDNVIAEIRERYLGEGPRPVLDDVACNMRVPELVESYIETHRRFEQYEAAVQQAAETERAANVAIMGGDFCSRAIMQQQSRAIDSIVDLDLSGVMLDAQTIAECAPVLQDAATSRLPSLRTSAQIGVTQEEIDTLRRMRGHALQIAIRMGYARDLRGRIVDVMESNLSVCR